MSLAAGDAVAAAAAPSEALLHTNTYFVLITLKQEENASSATHFDMKLQVFIHGIDVVEDILHYSGNDTHWVCVMEIPLNTHKQSEVITNVDASHSIINTR